LKKPVDTTKKNGISGQFFYRGFFKPSIKKKNYSRFFFKRPGKKNSGWFNLTVVKNTDGLNKTVHKNLDGYKKIVCN
jgi:hypothetical protein